MTRPPDATEVPLDRLMAGLELLTAAATAPGVSKRDTAWRERFAQWCAAHDLLAMPADEDTVLLFMHAHYPRWQHSYVRGFVTAIRGWHTEEDKPDPCGSRVASYLRILRTDDNAPRRQKKVDALRVQEARTIVSAVATDIERLPDAAVRTRALLLVARLTGIPPTGALTCAESLPPDAFTVTDLDVRIAVNGTVTLVDAERHARWYAVLRDALDRVGSAPHPLRDPENGRRRVRAAWRRAGLPGTVESDLATLDDCDLDWLLANVDHRLHKRRRNLAYMLVGMWTARRHAELANFRIDTDGGYLVETAYGYELWLDQTKNHPNGRRYDVPHQVADGNCPSPLCPGCALRDYLEVVHRSQHRTSGLLFATYNARRWRRMTVENGRLIVKGLWDRAGLDPNSRIATRALRAGGTTMASEAGWDVWEIAELSDHADLAMCQVYIRDYDPYSRQFFLDI